MKTSLIIFVRAPRSGHVKTRLAEAIGEKAACEAYVTVVRHLLNNLSGLSQVDLRFTPDDARTEISRWLRPGWQLREQGAGDLGDRLTRAFRDGFEEGSERIVIIGSDCPKVRVSDVESAWAALADHDVVLGPAKDGGYWLVGLRKNQADLFHAIPWSTAAVWETTLQRAHAKGLAVHCLREIADIDTVDDWQDYLAHHKVVTCGETG